MASDPLEVEVDGRITPGHAFVAYGKVPTWLIVSGVSPQAIAIYAFLAAHVNPEQPNGVVFPGMNSIALIAGITVPLPGERDAKGNLLKDNANKAKRYVDELVNIGALGRVRKKLRGMRVRNDYQVHLAPPEDHQGPRTTREFHRLRNGVTDGLDTNT